MALDCKIRPAKHTDTEEITLLFYNTIQSINRLDYSHREVEAWSSSHTDTEKWKQRISSQYFIVAVHNSSIVGFSSLDTDGYLDFLFVHKDFQKQGIATRLLLNIENKAIEQNNTFIYSNVSITARRFFEYHGFKVEKQQINKLKEEELVNFRMIKHLSNTLP